MSVKLGPRMQTTSCGGLNQECCSSSESDARARCPGGLYLTCEPTGRGGMCVPCGRYGQRCCEPLQEFGGKSYCPFAGPMPPCLWSATLPLFFEVVLHRVRATPKQA